MSGTNPRWRRSIRSERFGRPVLLYMYATCSILGRCDLGSSRILGGGICIKDLDTSAALCWGIHCTERRRRKKMTFDVQERNICWDPALRTGGIWGGSSRSQIPGSGTLILYRAVRRNGGSERAKKRDPGSSVFWMLGRGPWEGRATKACCATWVPV